MPKQTINPKNAEETKILAGAQAQPAEVEVDYNEIERKLIQAKNKLGLVGGTLKLKVYDETEHNVSAGISPQGWNIELSVRRGYNPVTDRRQKAYARKKNIVNGLEILLTHVGVLHEPAHWELPVDSGRGCPYDVYWHDKILEAVKQALPENKKSQADYVTNAFEDMIINPRCREYNGDFSGQVLFWDGEGMSLREKGLKAYTPIYEAFVKLNMHLFGDKADKWLVKRHYSNDKKVDKAVSEVIKKLNLEENISDTRVLFVKQNWQKMAEVFAKELADLLEVPPIERLSAYSKESNESSGSKKPQLQSGNGIEQKMPTSEGKEEIAFGRYMGREALSTNFTDYEQLDSLYRRLARPISVRVEAMTKESSMKISPLNFRPFDPETDDPAKVKVSKLLLGRSGLTFAYEREPITIEHRSKIQRRSFPDFKLVILDNSGSMKTDLNGGANIGSTRPIPWGDNSKYHYALLGFYGIENFLQNQGVAQYINHGLSLFSSTTRMGEANFFKLDELRKKALHPEWGGTKLDAKVLTASLRGRESFVLSISDGEIENWDSEKSGFKELAGNNYYAHVQIGRKTKFSQDLESWECPVFYVAKGEDLARLMVDIASDTYRRVTRT